MAKHEKLKVIVPGTPKGKDRPRANFYQKRIFTPKATTDYEEEVAKAWFNSNYDAYFNNEPLRVNITAFFKIPTSYTKKRVQAIYNGSESVTKKPDIDNIIKIILDGLNGVAYSDDKQVIEVAGFKKYIIDGTDERVEVELYEC